MINWMRWTLLKIKKYETNSDSVKARHVAYRFCAKRVLFVCVEVDEWISWWSFICWHSNNDKPYFAWQVIVCSHWAWEIEFIQLLYVCFLLYVPAFEVLWSKTSTTNLLIGLIFLMRFLLIVSSLYDPLNNTGIILSFFLGNYFNWSDQAIFLLVVPIIFMIIMFILPESPEYLTSRRKEKVKVNSTFNKWKKSILCT